MTIYTTLRLAIPIALIIPIKNDALRSVTRSSGLSHDEGCISKFSVWPDIQYIDDVKLAQSLLSESPGNGKVFPLKGRDMSKLKSELEGKIRPRKWCHQCQKWITETLLLSGDRCPNCKTHVTKGP